MRARPAGFFVLRTAALEAAELLRGDLDAWLARPEVRDALWTAAPSLAAAPRSHKRDVALTRYRMRMSGRATPFGLLAGWSTGTIGDRARLEVADGPPVSRLAAGTVAEVARRAEPLLREHLVHRPNPFLHRTDSQVVWIADGRLERAELDDDLRRVLDAAPGTPAQLGDPAFVTELVEAGLLVASLRPPLLGDEPPRALAARARALPGGDIVAQELDAAQAALVRVDAAAPGERGRALAALPDVLGVRPQVHTQWPRPAPGLELPRPVAEELALGVEVLRRLRRGLEPRALEDFRERFRARYDRRATPLLEALDADAGLGYGGEATARSPERPEPPQPQDQILLRPLAEAIAAGYAEIDLAPGLAELLERPAAPLAPSFAVLATLSAPSAAAVEAGDFEVRLLGATGPSGARMMGRFCHADPVLRAHVERHLADEAALAPDVVFAEIDHDAADGAGDIQARPVLRDGAIALAHGEGIALSELDLALEDDDLVLRERATGRRVLCRLTSAHNVYDGRGLGVYRFLAHLQFQHRSAGLRFDWGAFARAPRLPRLRVGRVLLAPARWFLTRADLQDLDGWRARSGAPRLVGVEREETSLPVDLDDPLGREVLRRAAGDDAGIAVHEWWPAPDRLPVTGPGGPLHHELLVPFLADVPVRRDPPRPRPVAVKRTFPPGSEWSYLKLYCGAASADRILTADVAAAVAGRRWHFLRYADPEHHLRIRVLGPPGDLLALGGRLVDRGDAYRSALDTYEREVERYGADMDAVEAVFSADSDAALQLLALPRHRRRPAAVAGVELLLRDLGLDTAQRHRTIRELRAGLLRTAPHDLKELSRTFRRERAALEHVLADPPAPLVLRGEAVRAVAHRIPLHAAAPLAHLHANRLLTAAPLVDELRVYDALDRLHRAAAARARA